MGCVNGARTTDGICSNPDKTLLIASSGDVVEHTTAWETLCISLTEHKIQLVLFRTARYSPTYQVGIQAKLGKSRTSFVRLKVGDSCRQPLPNLFSEYSS